MRGVRLDTKSLWVCPNCDQTAVTNGSQPHTRFHTCRGLAGILAPMVSVGVRAKIEVREREDYLGGEDVQLDGNRRPIMSVITTREDGQDVAVFAPTARGSRDE